MGAKYLTRVREIKMRRLENVFSCLAVRCECDNGTTDFMKHGNLGTSQELS